MVVLKKIKGSTLMETLVATVLIVITFMLASMVLNKIFYSSIKNDSRNIKAYLNELQYFQQHNTFQLPYHDSYGDWNISIDKYTENGQTFIELEAINSQTKKSIIYNDIEVQ